MEAKQANANPFQLGYEQVLRTAEDQGAAGCAGDAQHSMPPSEERAATKKSRAPRSASSRCVTLWANGTRRTSGRNSGTSTTARVEPGQSLRVFPLSNWTELDVWEYIRREEIPVVPLYFAKEREMLVRGDFLIPLDHPVDLLARRETSAVMCRMRSLGCTYCTGAVRSTAATVREIIEELKFFRRSERENRVIDHDQEGSMELKKREGYF